MFAHTHITVRIREHAGKEVQLRVNIDYDIGDFAIDCFIVQE